jgi:hypothetical protein
VSPIEGGVKRRLPSRVVGNFVVDQNVDHDIGHSFYSENVAPNPGEMQGRASQRKGLAGRAALAFSNCNELVHGHRGQVIGRDGEI